MALTMQRPVLTSPIFVIRETDSNATANNDVTATSATLYWVYIDNRANSAKSYLKLYNAAAPTVGTTAPDMILPCNGNDDVDYSFPEGIAFATAISFATVTTAGTAGVTGPTNDVSVTLVA